MIFTSTLDQTAFYPEQFSRHLLCLAPRPQDGDGMYPAYEEFIPLPQGQKPEWPWLVWFSWLLVESLVWMHMGVNP